MSRTISIATICPLMYSKKIPPAKPSVKVLSRNGDLANPRARKTLKATMSTMLASSHPTGISMFSFVNAVPLLEFQVSSFKFRESDVYS